MRYMMSQETPSQAWNPSSVWSRDPTPPVIPLDCNSWADWSEPREVFPTLLCLPNWCSVSSISSSSVSDWSWSLASSRLAVDVATGIMIDWELELESSKLTVVMTDDIDVETGLRVDRSAHLRVHHRAVPGHSGGFSEEIWIRKISS